MLHSSGEMLRWQMVDFSDQKAPKVIQTISTSIIVIFLNTVSCFVETFESRKFFDTNVRGSDLYEWMRKFVTECVVNQPSLGINFVTFCPPACT